MSVQTFSFQFTTKGYTDIIDITDQTKEFVQKTGIREGTAVLFCPGSTGSLTTIENEPGLRKDLKNFLEKYFPYHYNYAHHNTWHDDNGSSHLRSALFGPSLCIPIINSSLTLGTWQQIVFIDFDTRPRQRRIICQILS